MQTMETGLGSSPSGYTRLGNADPAASSFYQQTKLLVVKNFALLKRNKASTFLQIFIGMFFMILLSVINVGLESDHRQQETFSEIKDVPAHSIPSLTPCTPYDGQACYTFAYAPKSDQSIQKIVKSLRENGGGKPLPAEGLPHGPIGFETREEMFAWLYNNPNRTNLGVAFNNVGDWGKPFTDLSYTLMYNDTVSCYNFGITCTNPALELGSAMQVAVDAALLKSRYGAGQESAKLTVSLKPFPHPDLAFSQDAMKTYGLMFIFATVMFNFIIQLALVVKEKELRLREAMKQMGLRTAPYFVSWFITNLAVDILCVLVLCLSGFILDLDFFVKNSFALYFVLLLLTSIAFTTAVFVFAACLNRAEQARNFGFFLFIIFLVAGQGLIGYYYSSDQFGDVQSWLSLVLPIPFLQGLTVLINESSGTAKVGLGWGDVGDVPPYYPLSEIYGWLVLNIVIYIILTWYFDEVIPREFGVSRPWYFPFTSAYWRGRGTGSLDNSRKLGRARMDNDYEYSTDPKVRGEEIAVHNRTFGDRQVKVVVDGLRKDFKSSTCGFNGKTFTAVDGVSYAIDDGQLLCMLGHNGAGKTTTINMLTGMLPITDGDAYIFGHSARNGMDSIREIMGICPQHDVLWDQLTGMEHLRLFAGLKGMSEEEIEREAKLRLEQVELTEVADVEAQAYSGGMKRRLSLAVALIGDPKIVFLDEPTTGMDPVTRRAVWNMILKAKRGRIILLTTHSMEEADVLSDRICIMSKGKIQALGSSLHLKQQFGTGYRLTVFCDSAEDVKPRIKQFINSSIPTSTIEDGIPGIIECNIPRNCISKMPKVLRDLKEKKDTLHVHDISVSLATLEEVFLNLSKAEREGLNTLEMQQTTCLAVPIPPNVRCTPGMVIDVADTWGRQHRVTLTEAGISRGQEIVVIDVPENNSRAASEDSVEHVSFPNNANKTGYWSQVTALGIKTWRYQRRQKCQLCCLVAFPMFCIALLILLNHFISQSAVHYDVQCANNKTFKAYQSEVEISPSLVVGHASILNPGGFLNPLKEVADFVMPVARNGSCLGDKGTCDYGGMTANIPPQLRSWYLNVVTHVIALQNCQMAFQSFLNRHQSVNNALQWELEYAGNASHSFTPASGGINLQDCKINSPTTGGAKKDEGSTWKPPQAAFHSLKEQQQILGACQTSNISTVLGLYEKLPDPSAMPQKGAQHKYTSRKGLLGNYTSTVVPDPIFSTFENFVYTSISTFVPGGQGHSSGDIGELCQFFSNETSHGPAVLEYIESILKKESDPMFRALGNSLGNICWVRQSRDTIRRLSFVEKDGIAGINKALYDGWYGEKVGPVHSSKVGAYSFNAIDRSTASKRFDYVAWYNQTGSSNYVSTGGHLNWIGLVALMNNAILKSESGHGIEMTTKQWPKPPTKKSLAGFLGMFSIVDAVSGFFFPFVLFTLMPIVMSLIMYEKENRLREIMKMMGLKMGAYWTVTYVLFYFEYFVLVAAFWVAGAFANINFFTIHSAVVIFLYLFVWGHSLIAFSLLMTTLFAKTRTATAVGFISIFAFVFFGFMIFQTLQAQGDAISAVAYYAWQWMPPFAFMRIMVFLVDASTKNYPVTLANWGNTPIPSTLLWLVIEWFVSLILMYYLEQVLSVGYGVRRHPLFCCFKKYWCPGASKEETKAGVRAPLTSGGSGGDAKPSNVSFDRNGPSDVVAEAQRVIKRTRIPDVETSSSDDNFRVRIVGLRKKYPGRGGAKEKIAVNNLFLGVEKNECLGLLGPNGAGKTTSISMMCGLFEPTAGDGLVSTDSNNFLRISKAGDLDEMHAMMGVCPQHDVLWNDLTARDHVAFYGRLKGLTGQQLSASVQKVLADVKLLHVADKQAGKFSGGMKRRLSVANSLIGSPRVVYLDEPSTGLDPSARRTLWDVITVAKGDGKAIILTTHSMEEADALCDRVGIMALGNLKCIGQSADLKRRFGTGFALSIATKGDAQIRADLEGFVRQTFPAAKPMMEPINGSYTFEIPRQNVDLSSVFREVESARDRLQIEDWGITETTLEEVFLKATDGEF